MSYKYVAYTAQKKVVKGTLGVASESMAVATLEQAGLQILSLKKARTWNIEQFLPSLFRVGPRDVVLFSRQLAMLLERGTGFLTALQLSRDQSANRVLKRVVTEVIDDVRAGSTFSDALTKHPRIFSLAYSRMMRVGEQTGKLEVVLKEMAANTERDEAARRRVKSAMTYPAFILLIGLITVVVLITAVLPSLTRLFDEFDAELPLTTRFLMGLIDFVSAYKLYLLAAAVLLVFLVTWYARRPSGRYRFERLLLRLPVLGRISLLHSMCNYSRVMSMLLGSGLPMTEVMTVAQQSVHSEAVRHATGDIPKNLYQGQGLSEAMRANRLFPSVLVQMVATGEQTNTLAPSFAAVADHYESEFDETLTRFTTILEPLLLLLVGVVVGFIAVSVITPIYTVYNVLE